VAARLEITSVSSQEALVLRLSGALSAVDEIESLLDVTTVLPPPSLVVLDLQELSLLTVDGARTLHAFVDSLGRRGVDCNLVMAHDSPVITALHVAGPLTNLAVFNTVEQALADDSPRARTAGSDVAALAKQFASLTRALLDASTVGAVLRQIVAAATVIVPGADIVSVTLRTADGALSTPILTDNAASELDQVQYRTGEGPCVEAAYPDGPAYAASDDLTTEQRWPRFTEVAVRHGVGAVLSTDVLPTGRAVPLAGALNIYCRRAHGLTDNDRHATLLLATHASLALAHGHATELGSLQQARLRRAIDSRDVIGQAKGILMARQGLTADEAFDLLRRVSQDLNVKLVDLAGTIAARHTELGAT